MGLNTNWSNRMIADLQRDFGLSLGAAQGMVGAFAMESSGFESMQEKQPAIKGSRGGYGGPQWTGVRRKAFEADAKKSGLDVASYEAQYQYLSKELKGIGNHDGRVIQKLKRTDDPYEAEKIVTTSFLRPGVRNPKARREWTSQVVGSYEPYDGVATQLSVHDMPTPMPRSDADKARANAGPKLPPVFASAEARDRARGGTNSAITPQLSQQPEDTRSWQEVAKADKESYLAAKAAGTEGSWTPTRDTSKSITADKQQGRQVLLPEIPMTAPRKVMEINDNLHSSSYNRNPKAPLESGPATKKMAAFEGIGKLGGSDLMLLDVNTKDASAVAAQTQANLALLPTLDGPTAKVATKPADRPVGRNAPVPATKSDGLAADTKSGKRGNQWGPFASSTERNPNGTITTDAQLFGSLAAPFIISGIKDSLKDVTPGSLIKDMFGFDIGGSDPKADSKASNDGGILGAIGSMFSGGGSSSSNSKSSVSSGSSSSSSRSSSSNGGSSGGSSKSSGDLVYNPDTADWERKK